MKNDVRGKKKNSKSRRINGYSYLSPDDIYTGYINKEMHNNILKLNKRMKSV